MDDPEELKSIIFGKGFGAITDIEIGPDGYLYLLSIAQFGPPGESKTRGTIYRIVPADNPENYDDLNELVDDIKNSVVDTVSVH